jgi:hypothetical protein
VHTATAPPVQYEPGGAGHAVGDGDRVVDCEREGSADGEADDDADAVAANDAVAAADGDADSVAVAVTVDVADAAADDVGGQTQRRSAALHAQSAAHAGAASSSVHAGPNATPPGHHAASPAPQPAGAMTADVDRAAYVKADDDAQIAGEAPWQVSVAASHWRPVSHRVAERGPVKDAGAVPARAASQAPHEGVAVMPSADAEPR